MQFKKISTLALGIVVACTVLVAPVSANHDGTRTYRVTISNITAGQPFTPPVLLTHSHSTRIFRVGEAAGFDIQEVAENGNALPLLASLGADVEVYEVVAATVPLVPANDPGGLGLGNSATYEITAQGNSARLSFVSMLICTNDGITGLDSVMLPKNSETFYAMAYDARTEMNTEDFADMVPPCQDMIGVTSDDEGSGMSDPLLAESGVVIPHAGINGGMDLLPEVHGWGDPVAKIVIERVRD